jgi:alpha-ketoglutarate-dependent taurine dioxygenase
MSQTIAAADPRLWSAATIDPPASWYYSLPDACSREIEATLSDLRGQPRPLTAVRVPAERLAALQASMAPVRDALEDGRGFATVNGGAARGLSDEEAVAAYWIVGQALGRPFEQNVQGTLLYDVRDTGQDVAKGARFSVTNAETFYHTDNSFGDTVLDYVGLQCLRTARSGGLNQVVSGFSACEELRREHPEALRLLSQPFHVDRRGGVKEGETPTALVPIVEWRGGEPLFRYLRYWIEAGHQKAGQPLTPEQTEALELLDQVLRRPDLRAEFGLEPGQMFFINNRWILHNRTAFEDYPEPERRRHYVRLWLKAI